MENRNQDNNGRVNLPKDNPVKEVGSANGIPPRREGVPNRAVPPQRRVPEEMDAERTRITST